MQFGVAMNRSKRARLMLWLGISAAGAVIGYLYTVFFIPSGAVDPPSAWSGIRVGWFIAMTTSAFEIFAMRAAVGRWISDRSLWFSITIRTLVHTAIITAMLVINVQLMPVLFGQPGTDYPPADLFTDILFSLCVMGALLFAVTMRQLVGPRTFNNLMLGRYHKPRREERIFVLFDIVGSSKLAEQIGDEAFHDFVSAVFFDMDGPIVDAGGEVLSYVGDALIADWPLASPSANARAVTAVWLALDKLDARGGAYEARFGVRPQVRAVLHGGPVVAGETGDSRLQITYLGDVLNVTARIEALGKQTGAQVTISDSLLGRMELPDGIACRPLGAHRLKGVGEPVAVSQLVAQPGALSEGRFAATAGAAKNASLANKSVPSGEAT